MSKNEKALLEVKNIRKSFGKTEVLKGIDFTMGKGEVVAIIGSSGSGKTTLLRCLNFLETPDVGTISLDEKVIFDAENHKKLSDSEIRSNRLHFGLVFQSFNLFPQYNVKRNLTLAAELLEFEKIKNGSSQYKEKKDAVDAISKKADELLVQVGLLEKEKSYPCELSGGQQQRVAIARALALEPEVLCFDEPTSALDPELTGEVLKVIRELKNTNKTMIVVTHEMEFAKNVADTIIYMADGVIEEMGPSQEVFENPKSEKLKSFLKSSFEKL
ncbi:MAG: amino acid ABC transporter ATP-binding protein [Ruminococcaceae bacterium]|nr:amino acid ABC transporter ATP-binding protein [Oscillospiraceae bacterium]